MRSGQTDERTVGAEPTLAAPYRCFVEGGSGLIPVDVTRRLDAASVETRCARTILSHAVERVPAAWKASQPNRTLPAALRGQSSNWGIVNPKGEPPDTPTVTMPRTAQQRVTVPADASREGDFAPLSKDSGLAAEIKAMIVSGDRDAARERFADLVALQQRRASRIAYHCLRDVHDADEAVQDAFVKVFTHLTSYREDLPFEVWFTRILVNGCLDLRKARARRLRWVLPASPSTEIATREPVEPQPNPEDRLLATECGRQIAAAVAQLPERQRAVFTLCQIGGQSAAEVSQALGLSEPTVRVHLFRAIRKLRGLLERGRTR